MSAPDPSGPAGAALSSNPSAQTVAADSPLEPLLRAAEGPKVSIYFPTHRAGPETVQDAGKLAKALDEAKEKLVDTGMSRNRADKLLERARRTVEREAFWQQSRDGLACFVAPDMTRFVRLDGPCPTLTVVADDFHLRPLLLAAARDGEFYVLTITRDNVSLFRGNAERLEEVEPEGMITGIEDVTWKTDFEDQAGFHPDGTGGGMPGDGFDAGRGGGGADGAPRYHALGTSSEDYDDVEFEKFLAQVAKAVDAELVHSDAPLLLVADPRTVGWYRKQANYRHLLDEDIQKNPQDFSLDAMHEAAWEMVRPHLNKARDEALERLEARLGSGDEPASNELSTLVKAAGDGRIDTLFLARHSGERDWGTYDAEKRALEYGDGPGAQDLVNLVAVNTMRNGGIVAVMPEAKAGELGQAAAIMRY